MKIVLFIYLFVHFFSIIIFYDHKRKCSMVLVRDDLTALRQMKSISQRRNNCWKRKIMSCEGYERGRKDITTMKPFISYSKRGCDSPDPPSASSLFCYRRVSSTGAAWTGYGLQGLDLSIKGCTISSFSVQNKPSFFGPAELWKNSKGNDQWSTFVGSAFLFLYF